jgi:hypothetical protein
VEIHLGKAHGRRAQYVAFHLSQINWKSSIQIFMPNLAKFLMYFDNKLKTKKNKTQLPDVGLKCRNMSFTIPRENVSFNLFML